MQEILIRKLYAYISDNNPDLLLKLEQDNKVAEYLHLAISTVDDLIHELLQENKPAFIMEELCMDQLTKPLRSSRFNYIKAILVEEFSHDFEQLHRRGILTTELINMIAVCEPVFDELGFSDDEEDKQYLRYAVMGALFEYLNGGEVNETVMNGLQSFTKTE